MQNIPKVKNLNEPITGLGDVFAKTFAAVGIKPCGGCKRRQAWLNRMFPFRQQALQGTPENKDQ